MDLKEVKGIVNHIDIDDTKEVRVQVNYGDGSGACYREIYLHPAFWTDNKALLDHYISDEWLVVIPKEN